MFYDKDRDGFVTDKEILNGVKLMYEFRDFKSDEYSPEKCVQDLFKNMDINNDQKLSKQEFIDGCLSNDNILNLLSPFDIS